MSSQIIWAYLNTEQTHHNCKQRLSFTNSAFMIWSTQSFYLFIFEWQFFFYWRAEICLIWLKHENKFRLMLTLLPEFWMWETPTIVGSSVSTVLNGNKRRLKKQEASATFIWVNSAHARDNSPFINHRTLVSHPFSDSLEIAPCKWKKN